jgi:indolepyruvate ferredoxin oxidoreductase alpha subunit
MKIDKIKARINAPADSAFILQGNAAFALGVIHAGYHAATGYAGTPSTEVIDKTLAHAQDQMSVGWSVNESVAVSTGVGHAIAGNDALVTMKIPGVFQAADAITTSAFFSVD